jgi:hypothetical protein
MLGKTMSLKVLNRREFFAFFQRPIYGHVWLLWIAVACLLIGWRISLDPTGQKPVEDFSSMGKAAITAQLLHIGYDPSDRERCRRLFEKTDATARIAHGLFFGAIALGAAWAVWAVW